jgi:hypothetical protein
LIERAQELRGRREDDDEQIGWDRRELQLAAVVADRVRTRSEVDVLDDGFKWRKYGKKAVKSSTNPRELLPLLGGGLPSEEARGGDRDDQRYVVTAYDGVHNTMPPVPAWLVTTATPRRAF